MSAEDPPRGSSPSRRGKKAARRARDSSRLEPAAVSSTGNVIEFVDSQDPNVKSAIQRHTAYHSAAQRREARLKSLKKGSSSRYLEWGRRLGSEQYPTTSPNSSTSSVSASPVPSLAPGERSIGPSQCGTELMLPATSQSLRTTPNREFTLQPVVLSPSEEAILQFCEPYIFSLHLLPEDGGSSSVLLAQDFRVPAQSQLTELDEASMSQHSLRADTHSLVKAFIRSDEACVYLLVAYCFAMRSRLPVHPESDTDRRSAQQYFGRGTNILWNRLRDTSNASSDVNIQAVMLLVAYTSDYGQQNEVEMHADALRTMVTQRGGVNSISQNIALHQQLVAIETSRQQHLTLACTESCPSVYRFPQGFWSRSPRSGEQLPKETNE